MKFVIPLLLFASVAIGKQIPQNDDIIPGEYFLGLNTDLVQTRSQANALVERLKTYNVQTVRQHHIASVKILFVKADEADILEAEKLPEVRYSAPNGMAYIAQCSEGSAAGCWGLDRSDQRGPLSYSSPSDPGAVYTWGLSDGEGVDSYVGDTGIDEDHPDFGGRAIFGYTAAGIENPGEDNHGHGTHCAGTVGSNSYGVAKGTTLIGVKQMNDNGSGPWSAYIDAIDWVAAQSGAKKLLSLSLSGGCCNQAVEDATNAAIDAGVSVIAAAGNSDRDACLHIPAAFPRCITIGASDVADETATFSNFGDCVDLYAPGVSVLSTATGGGTAIMSGTSMACPHAAGLVARYMSSVSAPTPESAHDWIVANATPDVLTFQTGQVGPNLLMYAPFCE